MTNEDIQSFAKSFRKQSKWPQNINKTTFVFYNRIYYLHIVIRYPELFKQSSFDTIGHDLRHINIVCKSEEHPTLTNMGWKGKELTNDQKTNISALFDANIKETDIVRMSGLEQSTV